MSLPYPLGRKPLPPCQYCGAAGLNHSDDCRTQWFRRNPDDPEQPMTCTPPEPVRRVSSRKMVECVGCGRRFRMMRDATAPPHDRWTGSTGQIREQCGGSNLAGAQ